MDRGKDAGGRAAERRRPGGMSGRPVADCRRDGGGVVVVLGGWLVRNKSKTNCVPCFMVLFNVVANLFCTVGRFAPMAEAVRWWWRWWRDGWQPGSLAGLYPPLDGICWDDKWV